MIPVRAAPPLPRPLAFLCFCRSSSACSPGPSPAPAGRRRPRPPPRPARPPRHEPAAVERMRRRRSDAALDPPAGRRRRPSDASRPRKPRPRSRPTRRSRERRGARRRACVSAGSPPTEDLVIASVVRLRPDVFDEEFFRDWRDTYRRGGVRPGGRRPRQRRSGDRRPTGLHRLVRERRRSHYHVRYGRGRDRVGHLGRRGAVRRAGDPESAASDAAVTRRGASDGVTSRPPAPDPSARPAAPS